MGQIIASAFARSADQVGRLAARAAMAGADWLELRLDHWPPGADVAPAVQQVRLPVLVACRTPEHGGCYRGTLGERRELLTQALLAGAQGLDLDLADSWTPPSGRTRLKLLIRSFHSFTGVPKELPEIQRKLARGAVAKLVVTAPDLADAAPVLALLQRVDQDATPTVAFAMGSTAWPTRLLALACGAPFAYGSIGPGEETAPGQVPVELLAGLYRAHTLGPATAIFGLLGNPALHSLSPWLHNRALRRLDLDGIYLPFETARPAAVLAMLPAGRLHGLSVTAPHKAAMAAACERVLGAAAATGVVNTLVRQGAGFDGHNTDVEGVREALVRGGGGEVPGGAQAVVLGAGGAARAGAFALKELGCEVTMLGRSLDAARPFAQAQGIRLGSLSQDLPAGLDPAIVVQATPLGSLGRDPDERPLPAWRARPGVTVLDMVYRPRLTRFLRDAEQQGARIVPGCEMFLAQAAAQLRLLTGRQLAIAELRDFLAGAC
jgi:3-dehydroquinate dehydratase/shikimate dehydrogenase